MKKQFILSIDQGTTSSRAILFTLKGKPVYSSQKEFTQYFPKSGWVEHNPEEIWSTTKKTLKDVLYKAKKLKGNVFRIGHLGDFNDISLLGTLSGVEMGLDLIQIPIREAGVEKAREYLKENL